MLGRACSNFPLGESWGQMTPRLPLPPTQAPPHPFPYWQQSNFLPLPLMVGDVLSGDSLVRLEITKLLLYLRILKESVNFTCVPPTNQMNVESKFPHSTKLASSSPNRSTYEKQKRQWPVFTNWVSNSFQHSSAVLITCGEMHTEHIILTFNFYNLNICTPPALAYSWITSLKTQPHPLNTSYIYQQSLRPKPRQIWILSRINSGSSHLMVLLGHA